ncbi:MAG: ubiquitin-conjugating enzyme E2 variant, partial [Candidatus Hodarchaeales archaeon]
QSMDRDFILAREAQLVYSNNAASGFNPIGESLARWRGTLTYTTQHGKNMFTFELFLPEYFPNVPPVVTAVGWMDHPNVDNDGFIQLRILENWRGEFHLYQVIIALKNLMSRVPPTPRGETARSVRDTMVKLTEPQAETIIPRSSAEMKALRGEVSSLNERLTSKDEELARLRAQTMLRTEGPSEPFSRTTSANNELESERIAISDLLSALEDRYGTGEISIFEYSRLYKKYTKELYIIRKQLEHLG